MHGGLAGAAGEARYLDLAAHDAEFAARMDASAWARIRRFRDYPRFLDGVRRHEGVMQPFFANNLVLNRVVTEVWRFQILVFTLYLHATRDAADPRSGLTVGNLQRICAKLNLASPGRVNALLNIMKFGGYLAASRSQGDSRVVQLEPTLRFMAIVEEWNANIFASIDAATAGADQRRYGPDMLADLHARHPELGRGMRTHGAEGLLDGWSPIDPFTEVIHFAASDGGWLMMEHLVLRAMKGGNSICITPVALNMRATARQFGGSRSNLMRLLETGYEIGLLDEPPRGGSNVVLSSRMVCSFLTFMASFLGYFEESAAAALQTIRDGAA